MADKRNAKRRIKRLHITFLCGEDRHRGISSNVSYTGLFVKTRKKFLTGAPVNMIVNLEEDQKVTLRGVIARSRITSRFDRYNDGVGIELSEVPQVYTDFVKFLLKDRP